VLNFVPQTYSNAKGDDPSCPRRRNQTKKKVDDIDTADCGFIDYNIIYITAS
jgi:hypothetical protein